MFRIYPELVKSDPDWEWLRKIRNSCRQGMTHNQKEISDYEQNVYRLSYDPTKTRHYIYYANRRLDPIGFSRLEEENGNILFTYGVAEWARGEKFGWEVFACVLLAAGSTLKGDVLLTNTASQKIMYELGCTPIRKPHDGIQDVMCFWPPDLDHIAYVLRDKVESLY